jgi:hypothetical protein
MGLPSLRIRPQASGWKELAKVGTQILPLGNWGWVYLPPTLALLDSSATKQHHTFPLDFMLYSYDDLFQTVATPADRDPPEWEDLHTYSQFQNILDKSDSPLLDVDWLTNAKKMA